jgi:hypothetical protein
MEDNYFVPMFKELDRTELIVYRSVKYNKIEVGVPRCRNCKNIHVTSKWYGRIVSWLAAIISVVLGIMFLGYYVVFMIIISPLIGFLGGLGLEYLFVIQKGIRSETEGAKKESAVHELSLSGWSLKPPMS